MIKHPYKIKQVGYDPVLQLLAAVVLEAVRDCTTERNVSTRDRESARLCLSGEEGIAWLRAFGIPLHKGQAFVANGHRLARKEESRWINTRSSATG